jgi:hypothetical protein
MTTATKILNALDRAIHGGPQNSAGQKGLGIGPAPAPGRGGGGLPATGPFGGQNLAPAINATIPGSKDSPMDHVKVLPRHVDLLANVPFPSPASIRAVADEIMFLCYGELVSEDERAQLVALDKSWMRLSDLTVENSNQGYRSKFYAHQQDLMERLSAGDDSFNRLDAWSENDFMEEADERKKLLRVKMKEIEAQAKVVAAPVFLKFAGWATEIADNMAEKEESRSTRYAVPYVPSAIQLLVRKAAAMAESCSLTGSGRPAAVLQFLNIWTDAK